MDKKNEVEEKLILHTASATWHSSVAAAQQRFKVVRTFNLPYPRVPWRFENMKLK